MYLLDTNVVSELRKARPHGAVTAWIASCKPAQLNLAGVVVGEIQIGAERTREQDPVKAAEIESWLIDFIDSVAVVPMDAETFRIWAKLMHHKSAQLSGDAMIAATALQHGLTVVTRNTRDFKQFPAPLLNPFEQP